MAQRPVRAFDFGRRLSKSCDLLPPSVHYCGMARSVRVRSPCFAIAIQLACGLETVELRDSTGGEATGLTVATEQEQMGEDELGGTVTGAGSESAISPVGGLDGTGELDFGTAAPGCKKVDFLFVIDNSPSMAFAQENLRNSFAGFLGVLNDKLQANDFNVMVVDTDGASPRDDEEEEEGDTRALAPVDPCDDTVGAGRRANAQTTDFCSLAEGRRYATLDQPDLEPTFACMATVGTRGSPQEQTIDALLAAVSTEQTALSGCNAGFLRSDAILVTTIITNTDDSDSLGAPQDWYDALLALKGGNEASVVMLGFLPGDPFNASSSGLFCNVLAAINRAPRLEDFVARFTHHRIASVCEADYGPYFALAVENIDSACNDFVAPLIQ
jgi:hypothetical protein